MSDELERIWAWKEEQGLGVEKFWISNPDKIDGSELEYIRADLHQAQARRIEALEAALKPFVEACDASKWRKVMGENLKRILVAPTAIDRARAALSKGTEGG